MYIQPERARLIYEQRIQEMRAQARGDRLAAQARRDRRSGRSWPARLSWVGRRSSARRLRVGNLAPRKA